MERSNFCEELTATVLGSLGNFYGAENWDEARYGARGFVRGRVLDLIGPPAMGVLRRLNIGPASPEALRERLDEMLSKDGAGLAETYGMLADDYSRRAFVEVLAYRLLGYRRVMLWTNAPAYRDAVARASALPRDGEEIAPGVGSMPLRRMDLRGIGYPITLYTHAPAVAHQFLRKQYAYEPRDPPIWISDGDVVIDGGAAWGDTSLLFAHAAGTGGRVFAFEFEPANLTILQKNLDLNPALASRITLMRNALWRDSETTLRFTPTGPGTRVHADAGTSPSLSASAAPSSGMGAGRAAGVGESSELEVASMTIDDLASSLPRVDFIKMDIEGAETAALEGAVQTIRTHRPKLAISLYHSLSDFVDIPGYLASLGVSYDYYVDHATIHAEETVLFAAPR